MNTPETATEIKAAIAAALALMTSIWGWTGWAVWIWIACMAADYFSGSAAARRCGEWSSSIARDGLWHKLGEVFAVLVAALCDIALHVLVNGAGVNIGVKIPAMVTPLVLLWYIITELGSIAENAGKLGAPVPKWLQKSLAAYKEKIDAQRGDSDKPPAFDASNIGANAYQGKHTADEYAELQRLLDEARSNDNAGDEQAKTDK